MSDEQSEKVKKEKPKARLENKGRKAIAKMNESLKQLVIEYLPLNEIIPNEYNPNRQSQEEFELLCRSIEEDGFTQPIIVMRDGNKIVDGEHRWRAAHALGMAQVPVVKVDYTDAQRKIATLRHNRARGSEDIELTADVLKDLEKLGQLEWARDSLMLSEEEIGRLLEDVKPPEAYGSNEDFSPAWIPVQGQAEDSSTEESVKVASTEARAAIYSRVNKLEEAKNDEERKMVRQETKVKTLSFTFTQEQFDIIWNIIKENPPQIIFELCKAKTTPIQPNP